MNIFQDVRGDWDGKPFRIASNRVLGAIATVEGIITLYELYGYAQRGTAPVARLAQAYGCLLRYAGVEVSDDVVYAKMLGSGENVASVSAAITGLLDLMIPESMRNAKGPPRGNGSPAAARGSKGSTKRRSATA